MGARLFDRTTRSVTLTGAGRRLQPVAERVVAELRAAGTCAWGSEATVRSPAGRGPAHGVGQPVARRSFACSRTGHPQVGVHLADVEVSAVRRSVVEGEVDIGLGFFVKPAVGLCAQPLCKFRLMRISPPSQEATGHRAQPALEQHLGNVPLVSLPTGQPDPSA